MIFHGKQYDNEYHWWFAWRPVRLSGPDEWDRERFLDCGPRWVWLRWIYRMKCQPEPYYALFDSETERRKPSRPSKI